MWYALRTRFVACTPSVPCGTPHIQHKDQNAIINTQRGNIEHTRIPNVMRSFEDDTGWSNRPQGNAMIEEKDIR